jgi:hypothetical protein
MILKVVRGVVARKTRGKIGKFRGANISSRGFDLVEAAGVIFTIRGRVTRGLALTRRLL